MLKLSLVLCLISAVRVSAAAPAASKPNPKIAEYMKEVEKGEAGDPVKQTAIGIAYMIGQGVPKDEAKGAGILRVPAERGYAMAQLSLGHGLLSGAEGRRNLVEAARWLEQAAEQGNTDAQMNLAIQSIPVEGGRVPGMLPEDPEKTYFWSTLTMLTEDNVKTSEWRKMMIKRLSPERIAALDARLLAWEPKRGLAWKGQKGIAYLPCFPCMRRMADDGDPYAQWMMGNAVGTGVVFAKNDAQSLSWYRRSAAQGHLYGQRSLAEAHYFGRGVPVDNAEAYFWISFVADAADKAGWYDKDIDLQMVAEDSYDKVGKPRAEELDRKRAAWKPVAEKKAANPKGS